MKVWVLNDESHGEVSVFAADTDVLAIPFVRDELSYLEGGYEDERDEFISDVADVLARGRGIAQIEERFTIELQDVG